MHQRTSEIQFRSRARLRTTYVARERAWLSCCGRYKVVEARSLFRSVPTVFYAEVLEHLDDRWMWDVISRHRKRAPAAAACARHAKKISHAKAPSRKGKQPLAKKGGSDSLG
jgi:hypothetical protein